MLERLHFVLGGCVGEGTQDSDCILTLNKHGASLEEEGALPVVVCALCNAPSKVAQEVHAVCYYYYYYYYYFGCRDPYGHDTHVC